MQDYGIIHFAATAVIRGNVDDLSVWTFGDIDPSPDGRPRVPERPGVERRGRLRRLPFASSSTTSMTTTNGEVGFIIVDPARQQDRHDRRPLLRSVGRIQRFGSNPTPARSSPLRRRRRGLCDRSITSARTATTTAGACTCGARRWPTASRPSGPRRASPTGSDEFGAYWNVPIADAEAALNFIIHKGDEKDPGPDQSDRSCRSTSDAWIVSGDETIYETRAAALEPGRSSITSREDGDYGDYSRATTSMTSWGLHVWTGAAEPDRMAASPSSPAGDRPLRRVLRGAT